MIHFGKCLQHWQEEKNVTSAQLARDLGVHRQQIYIWRNKKNVRLNSYFRICHALRVPIEKFLLDEYDVD